MLERVMGIEPTYSAWEADVLPLNYTRCFLSIVRILQSIGEMSRLTVVEER